MSVQTLVKHIPLEPRVSSTAVHVACEGLFGPSPVDPHAKFTYATQNDFGREINTLLFCTPKQGFSSSYFANLQEIGQREGFTVQETGKRYNTYSPRDPKLLAANGYVLRPNTSDNATKAVARLQKRAVHVKDHSAVVSSSPSFKGGQLGNVAHAKLYQRSPDGLPEGVLKSSRLYIEGGNSFRLTNKEGQPRYLIGKDLLIMTHQILRMDKWFTAPTPNDLTDTYFNEDLLMTKYSSKISEHYIAGHIPQFIDKTAQEISSSLSDDAIKAVLIEMASMSLLTEFRFETEEDKKQGRKIATNYLAQINYVKSEIFPEELSCDSDAISYLTQAAYHLDVMMAPGPKGSIFVQDYDRTVSLLEKIRDNALILKLTPAEQSEIEKYIASTREIGNELKPLIDQVKKEVTAAGFTVIPAPAAFYRAKTPQATLDINFINCITGYSAHTNHHYYIAPGAQTESKLGEILMDAYVEFLKNHCGDISVYFTGRHPENGQDYSEAMSNLNKPTSRLGPHCLSYELKFSPHSQN